MHLLTRYLKDKIVIKQIEWKRKELYLVGFQKTDKPPLSSVFNQKFTLKFWKNITITSPLCHFDICGKGLDLDVEGLTKSFHENESKNNKTSNFIGHLTAFAAFICFAEPPLDSAGKSLNFWPATLHHTSSWSFLAGHRDGKAICLALPGGLTSTLKALSRPGFCRWRRCQSDPSRLCLAIRLAATSVVPSFTRPRQTMPA